MGWQDEAGLEKPVSSRQFGRVTIDSAIMNGQPCIRGMRLTVRRVPEAMATYPERHELFAEYPELEEDLRQALEFAAGYLDDEEIAADLA